MYLERVAANLRDYIDIDSQPTIIDDGPPTVRAIAAPTNAITTNGTAGPNEVAALGKERVPFIQEYALRIRQIVFSAKTGPSANYTIAIDHYVECWNHSNRDIVVADLGPNPFLLIADQPGWDAGTGTGIPTGPSRDLKLLLSSASNVVSHAPLTSFPAGSCTVLCTDPTILPALTPDPSRVYLLPITPDNGLRTYSGTTNRTSGNNLRLNMIDRTVPDVSDYETELALGNDFGILESAWGGAAISSAISINVDDGSAPLGADSQKFDDSKYHFRGASLRGNATSPYATTGDPRTNAEQLRFDLNGGSASNDKTRYFSSGLTNNTVPANSTLGAANANFVNPNNWPDYSSNAPSPASAPAVIANAALSSIGQLGDVFDPARVVGDSGEIILSRGGGRTLNIGQPDDLNGVAAGTRTFNANWFNSAWRLTDLFEAQPVTDPTRAPVLAEAVAAPTGRGRININGVLRDDGVAFRAALRNFNFLAAPESDPQLNGVSLPQGDIDNLIASIKTYLTANGPILERGELSQISFFNKVSGTQAGNQIGTTIDRGREEIFRRTVQMITTRSSSFTVYAIGQAVRHERVGGAWQVVPVGQKGLAVTFRVEPQTSGTPLASSPSPEAVADSYKTIKVYAPN